MSLTSSILVLRCLNLDTSRRFYEALGLAFTEEQHGKGPVHFACEIGAMVFELYPPNDAGATQNLMLGFTVDDLGAVLGSLAGLGYQPKSPPKNNRVTVLDPDGNAVMLSSVAEKPL